MKRLTHHQCYSILVVDEASPSSRPPHADKCTVGPSRRLGLWGGWLALWLALLGATGCTEDASGEASTVRHDMAMADPGDQGVDGTQDTSVVGDAGVLDSALDGAVSPPVSADVGVVLDSDVDVPDTADGEVDPVPDRGPTMGLDLGHRPSIDGGPYLRVRPRTVSLSDQGGTYPRVLQRANGTLFGTFDSGDVTHFVLRTMQADHRAEDWAPGGSVAREPQAPGRTLGNAFPFEIGPDRLLCAFRHHDAPGEVYVHRLLVSSSADGGATWGFSGEIEVDAEGHGLWEPFLFSGADGDLHVYYSREHAVGGKQDVVMRRSADEGRTWGRLTTVASHGQSRDGMPAVARLRDGTLLAVFEAFRNDDAGPFVIRSVQSPDDGLTWDTRAEVYVPADPTKHAGSPYVVTLADGRLLVSFMTDEESDEQAWPDHAQVKLLLSEGVPGRGAVTWKPYALVAAPAPAYWPSLTALANGEALVLYGQDGPKGRRVVVGPH